MENDGLREFSEAFHADIASNAHAMDMLREHAFVEKISETLIDYGEMEGCEPCHFQMRGMKVDAYDFDDEYTILTLVISHWLDESDPSRARVINSEIDNLIKRGRNYLEGALEGKLSDKIEISNSAHDLASLIHECRESLLSAKLILATDGIADQRQAQTDIYNGIEIRSVVWDMNRVFLFERTGVRERIAIDFESDYGGAIPCILRQSSDGSYVTYLSFVSGTLLADLYATWKIRLLERNVRVFLSQRVKVNQGIRDTIREEPDMFCA